MTNTWSEEAWEAAGPTISHILSHPFVCGLADGTLPEEKFRFYLQQDSLYLRQYFRVLAHISARLSDTAQAASFIDFAAGGVAVEQALHQSYLHSSEDTRIDMSPACRLYTSVLLSSALDPVEIEAAAILPCFMVYHYVGRHILKQQQRHPDNPYRTWIDTYADPAFAESTARATEICDALAENATAAVRQRMTEMFALCTRLEWMFWDSAWNLEQWKI